jgi:putative glutathione S-transferase
MAGDGWTFEPGEDVIPDMINGFKFLHQVYTAAAPDYSGRVTVPVLWDKKSKTIVSNESSEIIRMLNNAFDDLGAKPGDYYPEEVRPEIDEINKRVYSSLNNGVYKCGFATTQTAYEAALIPLFDTLDWLENKLSNNRYLVGNSITEADWRLFTTLVRFDPVYVGHFKCNIRRLMDYPNLSGYVRDLYQVPGVAETVNMQHIKKHYYGSHETINPTRVIPVGPYIDYSEPHSRADLS